MFHRRSPETPRLASPFANVASLSIVSSMYWTVDHVDALLLPLPPYHNPTAALSDVLTRFSSAMRANHSQTQVTAADAKRWTEAQKRGWWAARQATDSELQAVTEDMAGRLLGYRRALLCGVIVDADVSRAIDDACDDVCDRVTALGCRVVDDALLHAVVAASVDVLTAEEVAAGVAAAVCQSVPPAVAAAKTTAKGSAKPASGGKASVGGAGDEGSGRPCSAVLAAEVGAVVADLTARVARLSASSRPRRLVLSDDDAGVDDGPRVCIDRSGVVLVLSQELQHLPWDALPCMSVVCGGAVGRMPSLPFALARCSSISPPSSSSSSSP